MTVVQIALRKRELVAVFINLTPVVLTALGQFVTFDDLFDGEHN